MSHEQHTRRRSRPRFVGGMRYLAAFAAVITLLCSSLSWALPTFERLLAGVEGYRSELGDVHATALLDYAALRDTEVTVELSYGEAVTIRTAHSALVCDWRDADLDFALRLLGLALAAPDLEEAFSATGRTLSDEVTTLTLVDGVWLYLLGGPVADPGAHLFVERDTLRLRAIEVSTFDGNYRLELNVFDLADGWLPSQLAVYRNGEQVLALRLESAGEL